MQHTLRAMRAERAEGDRGFTLIELLVVVVIIGILVAIAIPVFLNYREGAANKAAQSDIRGAITAVEQYYTDNNAYPAAADVSFTLSDGTNLKYVKGTRGYAICADNDGGDTVYRYDSTAGGSVKKAAAGVTVTNCTAP